MIKKNYIIFAILCSFMIISKVNAFSFQESVKSYGNCNAYYSNSGFDAYIGVTNCQNADYSIFKFNFTNYPSDLEKNKRYIIQSPVFFSSYSSNNQNLPVVSLGGVYCKLEQIQFLSPVERDYFRSDTQDDTFVIVYADGTTANIYPNGGSTTNAGWETTSYSLFGALLTCEGAMLQDSNYFTLNSQGGFTGNMVFRNDFTAVPYNDNSQVTSAIEQNTQQQQATTDAVNQNTQATQEQTETIKDGSVDTQQSADFFNNFQDESHGLTGIITAPLNMINNLTSSSCTPISLTIPFVNQQFTLPCMSTIYSTHFSALFNIWRIVTFGIVAYYVCVNIYGLVKGFKDPENDKVEVMEL